MHVGNGVRRNGKNDRELEFAGEVAPNDDRTADPLAQLKADAKRAKINAIWEQLNAKNPTLTAKAGRSHVQAPTSRSKPAKVIPGWMVSLGIAPSKTTSSAKPPAGNQVTGTEVSISNAASTWSREDTKLETAGVEREGEKEDARKIAAAALAAAKAAAVAVSTEGKVEISEVREFAGEDIQITKYVDPNSKAAQASRRKAEMQASSSSGLDALLEQISKKQKLNILDKSRKDWGEFKEEKGIDVELEAYKKSGDKYLDKVAFLQRADVREYEKERDARLALQSKRRDSTLMD